MAVAGSASRSAARLPYEGADVALVARDRAALDAAARGLSAETNRRIIGVAADTSSQSGVASMVAAVVRELGGVDVLVNAAARPGGQSAPPTLATLDEADIWDDLTVKVLGYVRCMRAVAPLMRCPGFRKDQRERPSRTLYAVDRG